MKIFYVVNARIPTEKAHGRQIVNMCSVFAEAGNAVRLVIPNRKNNITRDAFVFYNIPKNFEIERINGFDFFRVEKYIGRGAFYLQTFSFLMRLFFFNIPKESVVYTRNPEIAWIFSLRGYRSVYECHDWFKKNKNFSLFFLRHIYKIITTNSFIKDEFVKNGFGEKNILVAPNGVDLSIFDLNLTKEETVSRLSVSAEVKKKMSEKNVLLYTGSFKTMSVEKGIADILDSLKKIQRSDVIFVAVGGDSEDVQFYKKLAKEKGIENMVFLSGRVDQSDLALFQKSADILLMPFPKLAHYEYHMTPLKMFEYMASGRPIIASSLPSIKQILNEKNCLFCEPGNPLDLAEKINYILENKDIAESLSVQAKEDVQKYSWKNRVEKIISNLDF